MFYNLFITSYLSSPIPVRAFQEIVLRHTNHPMQKDFLQTAKNMVFRTYLIVNTTIIQTPAALYIQNAAKLKLRLRIRKGKNISTRKRCKLRKTKICHYKLFRFISSGRLLFITHLQKEFKNETKIDLDPASAFDDSMLVVVFAVILQLRNFGKRKE